jgi:hypothetical protein
MKKLIQLLGLEYHFRIFLYFSYMEMIHIGIFCFWGAFMLIFATHRTSERIDNYESRSKYLYEKAKEKGDENLEFFEKMYNDSKGGTRLFQISYGIKFFFYCYTCYIINGTVFI